MSMFIKGNKEISVFKGKDLYGSRRYFLQKRIKIKCAGGENMTEEKELTFLEPEEIPRLMRGQNGRNWKELFDQIPIGKVLAMDTEVYGSAPNIRAQVKLYNGKTKTLKVTQRTDKETEKTVVYVQRIE